MSEATRSPFGTVLRTYRLQRGLSQAALADRISERIRTDPALATLGSVSDRTINNLEAPRANPSKFARPRPYTVRILAIGLDIAPDSPEESTFLKAAEETRQRVLAQPLPTAIVDTRVFVREGREEHLQRLRDAWSLARAGQPQIVLIAGEAGSGKTHIIRELCVQAQIEDPSVRIAWGECTHGASSVSPYLPFFQGMNHLLGFTNREHDLATANANNLARQAASIDTLLSVAPALIGTLVDEASLTAAVDRVIDGHHDLRDRLNQVLGARNATAASGRLDQLVGFLSATSAASPVILVLEDLHWSGDLTSALLLHLQRQLTPRRDVPILILGSYRPSNLADDSDSTRHHLEPIINEIGRQVDHAIVDLKTSIGSEPGRAFISGLLQRLSIVSSDKHDLAEFLFNRTEGHPLFAVELIRWLRDTGGMERDADGLWHLRPAAIQKTAPHKVRAVIAERIERLPDNLRRILDVASVQGTTVTVDVLAGMQQLTDAHLDEALDTQLVTRYRLLEPLSPFQVGGRRLHRYQFRHAMFQEYVYETLSLRERERLHARAAELSASLLGEDPHVGSGEIAFHFRQAHQYKNAARHAYAAATYALRQLDYELADHWLHLTEEYAIEADDRWHIYAAQNGRVSVMRGLGDLDGSFRLASSIVAKVKQEGFADLEAECEDLLGQSHFDMGGLQSAIHHLTRAANLHRKHDQKIQLCGTEAMLSHTYYRLGAYDDALLHAKWSYTTAHELQNHAHEAEALLAAGNCELDLGMYEKAIATYQKAKEIYHRAGEVRGELLVALNTGLCHIHRQEWVEAVTILRSARHTTEVLRTLRLKVFACHYLSMALEGLGDHAAAKQEAERSRELREGFGQHGNINDNVATLLRIAVAEGDEEGVKHHLEHLHAWTRDCGGDGIEDPMTVYLSMAQAYTVLDDADACARTLAEGHALLQERASHIHDDEARRSYLEDVPANSKLIAWHERGTTQLASRHASESV